MATVTLGMKAMGQGASSETVNWDQEKDANTVLMELDKGLRSVKVGEQCESIVRFPRLFEKYPFPILINSAFLKLADVFRVGTNTLRLCILKVAQQSQRHHEKIINVDEFVRRIFQVIHSNDPLARAITLRTLGSTAHVISERKNIHHSIINGLDSHDAVELEAAISAAADFAAVSKSFADGICGKLAQMIDGLATPVDMKLKLIPVFQHMHHDAMTSSRVRELCTSLLPLYPARKFVLVTLDTMSRLAAKSLIDIPQQVELLLNYLKMDSRKAVKAIAIHNLELLAKQGPHMWTTENVNNVCGILLDTPCERLQMAALQLLIALSTTVAVTKLSTEEDSPIVRCCLQFSYSTEIQIAALGAKLWSHLAQHAVKTKTEDQSRAVLEGASLALESVVTVASSEKSFHSLQGLKSSLICVVELASCSQALAHRFIEVIIFYVNLMPAEYAVLLYECLSAISSKPNNLLPSLVPDFMQCLSTALGTPSTSQRNKVLVALVTLIFQATLEDGLQEDCKKLVEETAGDVDGWTCYKLGRQAARYGHHNVAAILFQDLATKVSTGNFFFWLSALSYCSQAESILHDEATTSITHFIRKITYAGVHYQKAISSLKASANPNFPLDFQCEYLDLRTHTLRMYVQVVRACCSFQTSPPPAIATSLALKTGQEVHRCGHVVAQLQKCGQELEDLCERYRKLHQVIFDVDPGTLMTLQIFGQSCQILMHILDSILNQSQSKQSNAGSFGAFSMPFEAVPLEHQAVLATHEEVLSLLNHTLSIQTPVPLAYQHMECIQKACMLLCDVPYCLPRYFFQSLQSTDIKLAISPQPRSPSEPLSIHYDTHLTLKVEGIIQRGMRPGLFRKVSAVKLSVCSSLQSRTVSEGKVSSNTTNYLNQTVQLHNDYFSVQFILEFAVTGIHQVDITAAVMDADGTIWNTGPSSTMLVKSYDEAVHRQQQHQYATQRHHHRASAAAAGVSSSSPASALISAFTS